MLGVTTVRESKKKYFLGCMTGLVFLVISPNIQAAPGPDTVVVIPNLNDPDSLELARRYAEVRNVPPSRICPVDLPAAPSMSLEDFQNRLMTPVKTCLTHDSGEVKIEAAVLMRGIPINVEIPVDTGSVAVSTSAALSLWKSVDRNGVPILGQAPGISGRCGDSPCLMGRWQNTYLSGHFHPGWRRDTTQGDWQPILVTALDGYSYDAAFSLVQSGLDAERDGPRGTFLLMDGGDEARDQLDGQLDTIAENLDALGIDTLRRPFDGELTGLSLGAFVVGAQSLGDVVEGNSYEPGSIVDNLTSYGAVPGNFMQGGNTQVSISRWVELGVAGVHGTTAEPISNAFPHRRFLVDYAQGYTLAESYSRNLPFTYWRNLILGDPMLAPYAQRPVVNLSIETPESGDILRVRWRIEDPMNRPLESPHVLLNGREVDWSDNESNHICFQASPGEYRLLMTARISAVPGTVGWDVMDLDGFGEVIPCPAQGPDTPDAFVMDSTTSDAGLLEDEDALTTDGFTDSDTEEPQPVPVTPKASGGCQSTHGFSEEASILMGMFLIWTAFMRRRLLVL